MIIISETGAPLGHIPVCAVDNRPLYDMQQVTVKAYVTRDLPEAPGIVRFNALTERMNTARTGHHPLKVPGVSAADVRRVLDALAAS